MLIIIENIAKLVPHVTKLLHHRLWPYEVQGQCHTRDAAGTQRF